MTARANSSRARYEHHGWASSPHAGDLVDRGVRALACRRGCLAGTRVRGPARDASGGASGVVVVNPDGRMISWQRVARLDGSEISRLTAQYAITGAQRGCRKTERRKDESHGRNDVALSLKPRASVAMSGAGMPWAGHRPGTWPCLASRQPRQDRGPDRGSTDRKAARRGGFRYTATLRPYLTIVICGRMPVQGMPMPRMIGECEYFSTQEAAAAGRYLEGHLVALVERRTCPGAQT